MKKLGKGEISHDKFQNAIVYEKSMLQMKKQALWAAALYKLSRYSDICILAWATLVLLGGFVSSLKQADFYLLFFLLLLQALHFTLSSTFQSLPSAHLFLESHHPNDFTHDDLQYTRASNRLGHIPSPSKGPRSMLHLFS